MAPKEPGFWDYLASAFNVRAPLPGLGHVPVNWLAMAGIVGAGFIYPPIWLIGTGLEIGFLSWLSGNGRFRNVVDGQSALAHQASRGSARQALFRSLSASNMSRYRALVDKCNVIEGLAGTTPIPGRPMDRIRSERLNELLNLFLRLLISFQRLEQEKSSSSRSAIESELQDVEVALSDPQLSERLRRSLEGKKEILQKRTALLDDTVEQTRLIHAELDRLEQQVELLRAESATVRDPAFLSERIDQTLSTLGETTEWMRRNADVLGVLEMDSDLADGLPPG